MHCAPVTPAPRSLLKLRPKLHSPVRPRSLHTSMSLRPSDLSPATQPLQPWGPLLKSLHLMFWNQPLLGFLSQGPGLVLSLLILHTLICSPDCSCPLKPGSPAQTIGLGSGTECLPAWWAWPPGAPQAPHTHHPAWS